MPRCKVCAVEITSKVLLEKRWNFHICSLIWLGKLPFAYCVLAIENEFPWSTSLSVSLIDPLLLCAYKWSLIWIYKWKVSVIRKSLMVIWPGRIFLFPIGQKIFGIWNPRFNTYWFRSSINFHFKAFMFYFIIESCWVLTFKKEIINHST